VKPAYIKGKEFDLAGSNVRARFIRSWGSAFDLILTAENGLYPEDITGYDKNKAGEQTLTLSLDGVKAQRTFPVYVVDTQPDVWFDYGFMRHAGDPNGAGAGFGKYHVEQGKTLVLSPVRYLIGYGPEEGTPAQDDLWPENHDLGASYRWTVSGGSYDTAQPRNGEFFTFKPTAAGTYTVSVTVEGRNYIDGTTIEKTATTEVVSFAPGTVGEKKVWWASNAKTLRNFAPGQFTESGSGYGWSLGTIGGYAIWSDIHREVYGVAGNEFGTWYEPGIVWLQEDNNGNGVPDEMWYEVKGPSDLKEAYRALITRRYAITFWDMREVSNVNGYGQTIRVIPWVDCKGRSGLMGGGWPKDWGVTGDWVTYTSTLIVDKGDINNGSYSGGGTLDMYRSDEPDPETGHILGYVDAGRTTFYIDCAMDAAGNRVTLKNVRFVKAQTAMFVHGGIFGEISTELTRLQ
jgi:hypothetical protein